METPGTGAQADERRKHGERQDDHRDERGAFMEEEGDADEGGPERVDRPENEPPTVSPRPPRSATPRRSSGPN